MCKARRPAERSQVGFVASPSASVRTPRLPPALSCACWAKKTAWRSQRRETLGRRSSTGRAGWSGKKDLTYATPMDWSRHSGVVTSPPSSPLLPIDITESVVNTNVCCLLSVLARVPLFHLFPLRQAGLLVPTPRCASAGACQINSMQSVRCSSVLRAAVTTALSIPFCQFGVTQRVLKVNQPTWRC